MYDPDHYFSDKCPGPKFMFADKTRGNGKHRYQCDSLPRPLHSMAHMARMHVRCAVAWNPVTAQVTADSLAMCRCIGGGDEHLQTFCF